MNPEPILWRTIEVPSDFRVSRPEVGSAATFGGDVRIGDLRNSGQADFLVYRSADQGHRDGGMKPCFLGAFTSEGESIWSEGSGGTQPARPGPVAIHDLDGDGCSEVICFFHEPGRSAAANSLADVVIQIRDGCTGQIRREAAPARFRSCSGEGANWVHQRITVANFRGLPSPRDFVVKLGEWVLAFDSNLEPLWEYKCPWTGYGHCPAYIPAAGDIDGDGRDEVNGGYFLLDHDGAVLWENDFAPHMDSVAIVPWDNGNMRAVCSGHGHVIDSKGKVVVKLGGDRVPHAQEVRIGRFTREGQNPQMVIRCNGHSTETLVANVDGDIINAFHLNPSRNHTGMEVVHWNRQNGPDLLYNGGMLWDPIVAEGTVLPGLPEVAVDSRMSWYHCIPADLCGDEPEELVIYNPWRSEIHIYTQEDNDLDAYGGYRPGPRQYNPRLMD